MSGYIDTYLCSSCVIRWAGVIDTRYPDEKRWIDVTEWMGV
ncbi:hypothetical protein LCGC14_1259220 [marine sediment metagenome]|uniref:Uncharacterized protein n=1 Tax=marine sediment metagenome TaxID=412755 RepID=A0A0F9L1A2_9ZZZZ